jgi:hypothetical protein
MTVDQIRTALDHMESNYALAMHAGDHDLAADFYTKIRFLWKQLVAEVGDPYTTEADIRYFEGLA